MSNENELNNLYNIIWYGSCADRPCTPYSLSSDSGIDKVYQVDGPAIHVWSNDIPTSQAFSQLECGHAYYIKLESTDGVNPTSSVIIEGATVSEFAEDGDGGTLFITDDCDAGGTDTATFEISNGINETQFVGYNHSGTPGNAQLHTGIITDATEIQSVEISTTNTNHLEYSTNGTNWSNLNGTKTLTQDFTQLQLRTKLGLTTSTSSTLTFVAETSDGLTFNPKTLSYVSTINPVSLSLSGNQSEILEEGAFGTEKTFTITQEGLSSITVTTDEKTQYHVSKTNGSGYASSVTFTDTELNSPSVSVYVKLIVAIGTTTKDATITATGTPSNGSTNISDTATITSNVKPRPVINSITINQGNLNNGSISASINTSHTGGYGAHHWHYTITRSGEDVILDQAMVNSGSGGYGPATIDETGILDNPGNYTITAWIVSNNSGVHQRVSNLPDKTQNFTIAVVPTSMTLNKSEIDRDIDVSKTIPSDTINITKANITDVSLSALTNWTATLNNAKNSIIVQYTGSKNISSVTEVLPETLTVTGLKGKRSGTPGTEITQTVTLDATLYKDAEFAISGNKSVTDNRTYLDAPTEHSFTLTKNKNVNYTVSGTLTNWQVSVNDGAYGNQLSALENLSENATFKFKHTGVNANTYPQETITFTPTQTAVDEAGLGAALPTAIGITLNSTISPKSTALSVTTLSAISVEINDATSITTNSESCTISYPNATLTSVGGKTFNDAVLTGATEHFNWSVDANGETFTYWLKDTSTIETISGESVNIIATADTNYIMNTSPTQTTTVILRGTVAGKATSLGVNDNSNIALGNVEQGTTTTGKQIIINDALNLASATISVSGGGFKISATDSDYGTDDVIINDPLGKDFYIKLDSSGAVGNANSTVTVSGTKSAEGASNPSDVTISCTANITAPTPTPTPTPEVVVTSACGECKPELTFDFHTDTLGGTATAFGLNNYTINGFEAGGSLCFNALHEAIPSAQSNITVHTADFSIFGAVMPTTQIVDGYIIYKAADGTFYDGTLLESSNMCLISPATCTGGGDTGGGDSAPCETCDASTSFNFHTDTLGGTATAFGLNNYTINGFEAGGSLCFNALHEAIPSAQSNITVHTADFSIFGAVMPTTKIVNGDIIYKSPSGTCYRGTLSESSNMCLISPM